MDLYQQYIHISRYSRWKEKEGRRETWPETVQRYIDFFDKRTKGKFESYLNHAIKSAILGLEVMPSMRALMTAGPALERENLAGYNCGYIAIDTMEALAEVLYVLMCGTGVGFSCERQEITRLPPVPRFHRVTPEHVPLCITVEDSKEGWAAAYEAFLGSLWSGEVPRVDYSKIRPAGERLKVFGGRASGPKPLKKLFEFTKETFAQAQGRKLNSLEIHDLVCMIGDVVVVGGVRRSALISLSNLSDRRMRDAKSGQWWEDNPHRALANNSVAYTEKPSVEVFMEEWLSLIKSKSGERGIFNRTAAQAQAARWGRRSAKHEYGCNPCSEILLRSRQLCNLTEVIVRANDTLESLIEKVTVATIMGTLQATLTDFGFVSSEWARNTKEEALLGVSLTGIMDNTLMSGEQGPIVLKKTLNILRDHARKVNARWAATLGINPSAAITCVKPSGTVSQLCDTASGIHARHNKHYIRTVRVDKKDPLYDFMKAKGFVMEDAIKKEDSTAIVSFPIKAPKGAVTRDQVGAIKALELWLVYQREWCEHKPSVTITVRDDEWIEVGAWVYKNFDEVSGISFLPHSEHVYQQAPYQDLTSEEYDEWNREHPTPNVDWVDLADFEKEDHTTNMQTLACTANNCEI